MSPTDLWITGLILSLSKVQPAGTVSERLCDALISNPIGHCLFNATSLFFIYPKSLHNVGKQRESFLMHPFIQRIITIGEIRELTFIKESSTSDRGKVY